MTRVLLRNIDTPNSADIDVYIKSGGYQALRKAYSMTPREVTDEVTKSGLRGRGGAWYPAGRKWEVSLASDRYPKYLIANADEGEPGTFKDRPFIEKDPHMLIEGMLISAYAFGAEHGYIYIRGEYPDGYRVLNEAIAQAYGKGCLGRDILGMGVNFDLKVYRGAGSYVCGEASALIESLEGKRGHYRTRPPYMAVEGAFSRPTVVNNVETLVNVPHIIENGADWFSRIGSPRCPGPKIFSLSGHVNRPGLYELPTGVTLGEIIHRHGGGVRGGKELKAVIPGGLATALLTREHMNLPMDVDSLWKAGSSIGSGAITVMDEDTCLVHTSWRAAKFFMHESCGKCTPCREGTKRIYEMLTRIKDGKGTEDDLAKIEQLGPIMHKTSLCGLGESAANHVLSAIKHFREEFFAHVRGKVCHTGTCKALAL